MYCLGANPRQYFFFVNSCNFVEMNSNSKPSVNYFKIVVFFLGVAIVSLMLTAFQYSQPKMMRWTIHSSSSIRINGSSNVNTFTCTTSKDFEAKPVIIEQNVGKAGGMKAQMQGTVTVAVKTFDCKNKLLDNDLRKTLKESEFPKFTIQFLELERMPDLDSEVDFLSGKVLIDLAGTKKEFYLRYSFNKTPNGYLLKGSRAFNFGDFGLTPPKKAGGLIRVNDNFDVGFTMILVDLFKS